MAKNRDLAKADEFAIPVPANTKSGDALVIGDLSCVALIDRDESDGKATVQANGAFWLSVKGIGAAANAAIPIGGLVYKDGADLNADAANGKPFGYNIDDAPVAAGETRIIKVKLKN